MSTIEQLGAKAGDRVIIPLNSRERHVCTIAAIVENGVLVYPPLPNSNRLREVIFDLQTKKVRPSREEICIEGYKIQGQAFPEENEVEVQLIGSAFNGWERYVKPSFSEKIRSLFH